MSKASAFSYIDVNVKAVCRDVKKAEEILLSEGAKFIGEDPQVDTFYRVEVGKMKLREGKIENLITHYIREKTDSGIITKVFIYEVNPTQEVCQRLLGHLQVTGVIKKNRKIFFIDNAKFHLDKFEDGKTFIEIEVMDRTDAPDMQRLQKQAADYRVLLGIADEDIITSSYVDL